MNKQYKIEMLDLMSDNTAAVVIEEMLDNIGRDLSNIINQNISDKECLDQIINYLKNRGLYINK